MKTIKYHLVLILLCAAATAAHAQSTAFTYQGRLAANGSPYTGFAEMHFTLFNALVSGVAVATNTPATASVNVTDGLFTVPLDFGAAAFPGADRWLEIQVRTNLGAFITLTPRQALTPTPYALFARTAGTVVNNSVTAASIASGQVVKSLNGLRDTVTLVAGTNVVLRTNGNNLSLSAGPWSPNGSDTFYNGGGNVGIGTTSPQAALDVNGTLRWGGTTTNFAYSGEDGGGLFIEQDAASAATHAVRLQTSISGNHNDYAQFIIDPINGFSFATLGSANGRVGIGTMAPQVTLDVRGDIRLGPSGQFRAVVGGEENLRIIRGSVFSNGVRRSGSGFTSVRLAAGKYLITFDTPFAAAPSVTGTAHQPINNSQVRIYVTLGFGGATTSDVVFQLIELNGDVNDRTFDFIAIGPR